MKYRSVIFHSTKVQHKIILQKRSFLFTLRLSRCSQASTIVQHSGGNRGVSQFGVLWWVVKIEICDELLERISTSSINLVWEHLIALAVFLVGRHHQRHKLGQRTLLLLPKAMIHCSFTAYGYNKKGVPSAVGSCTVRGLGKGVSKQPFPHTVQCVEAGAWTLDRPVTGGYGYNDW
jgi:hypothetical protein